MISTTTTTTTTTIMITMLIIIIISSSSNTTYTSTMNITIPIRSILNLGLCFCLLFAMNLYAAITQQTCVSGLAHVLMYVVC